MPRKMGSHKPDRLVSHDHHDRGTSSARGYDTRWARLRRFILAQEPLCRRCNQLGITKAADMVHHQVPVKVAPHLRMEPSNLEPLCWSCHQKIDHQTEYKADKPR